MLQNPTNSIDITDTRLRTTTVTPLVVVGILQLLKVQLLMTQTRGSCPFFVAIRCDANYISNGNKWGFCRNAGGSLATIKNNSKNNYSLMLRTVGKKGRVLS
jgi:hypothetical protein